MKLFLLKWQISIAYLFEGIIGTLTFGKIRLGLPVFYAKIYARYCLLY